MQPAKSGARALHGRMALQIGSRGGRTALLACERRPPLHVQRPLYLDREHPSLARVALLNTTAGLFAGDSLDVRIRLDEGAAVELTTPTMTRAFDMPRGSAEVSLRITAASSSYVEYLPEATILCRGATLRSQTEVDAQAGAVVALGEVTVFGRIAHGERHAYRELEQRTTIRYDGRPVVSEFLYLRPDSGAPRLGVVDDFAVYAGLNLIAGGEVRHAILDEVRALIAREERVWAGASLLAGDAGVGVRALGQVPSAVQAFLRLLVGAFRRRCRGMGASALSWGGGRAAAEGM